MYTVCKKLRAVFQCGWKPSKGRKPFTTVRYTVWSSHLWLDFDGRLKVRLLTASKFNFMSLSHVVCLKLTICGDTQTDAPQHTLYTHGWQLLAAVTSLLGCRWKLITGASCPPNKQEGVYRVCGQSVGALREASETCKRPSLNLLNLVRKYDLNTESDNLSHKKTNEDIASYTTYKMGDN